MKFSDYLDSVENTDDEQLLKEQICKIKEDVQPALQIPVVGKVLTAALVLGESESIEAFRQTEHYEYIKDWNIAVHDLEKGAFSLYPSDAHLKIVKVAAMVIGGLLAFLWIRRKLRKRRLR